MSPKEGAGAPGWAEINEEAARRGCLNIPRRIGDKKGRSIIVGRADGRAECIRYVSAQAGSRSGARRGKIDQSDHDVRVVKLIN